MLNAVFNNDLQESGIKMISAVSPRLWLVTQLSATWQGKSTVRLMTLPQTFKSLEWRRFFSWWATIIYDYLSYIISSIIYNNFLTLWTVGIKLEYCFPSWNTREHRVSMAVPRSSGHESSVLIMGWIIRDAKSVRSSDSLRRSRVSKAHLKPQQGTTVLTTYTY